MKRTLYPGILAIFLLSLVPTSGYAIVDGQTFQDWRAKCTSTDNDKNPQTTCHVFQDLLQKESGKRVLHIAIGYLPGKKPLAMIITLPLGISLPPGLSMRIDEKNGKQVPLQACFTNGCQTAFELEPAWQKKLMAGKNAEVIFYNIRNQAISIPVSLKGITAAINALETNAPSRK
jgi:invasion protein IalB